MSLRRSWFAMLTAALLVASAVMALFVAPKDSVQGDAYRLLFLHVPTIWVAFLAFGVTALASATYLVPRTRHLRWDLLAGASAEFGVLCTGLTLAVGSLWGRPIWGTWWVWDARLTTTAVLFFLYLGYLAVRRMGGSPQQRALRSAVAGLIAFVDVPIVHFSVTWWTTLHQDGSIFNAKMQVHIKDGRMDAALLLAILSFTMLYALTCVRRMQLLAREEGRAERELERAIAERIAGSAAAVSAAPAAVAQTVTA